jgi:hypothetical protein
MSIERNDAMNQRDAFHARRHFFATGAQGLGGIALGWLLDQQGFAVETSRPELQKPTFDVSPKPPHHEPQAKAMISLWMQGGPSHIDLFDPKPALAKLDGKKYPGGFTYNNMMMAGNPTTDVVLACPWKFERRGKCGMELSELLPHIGEIADEITLIRSMNTPVNNHGPSVRALQTGDTAGNRADRASLGSWITYGLGAESQNLPAFVALTDTPNTPGVTQTAAEFPVGGTENWSAGFLPSVFQGTVVRYQEPRIANLTPFAHLRGKPQESSLALLERMNRRHLAERPGNDDLAARTASFQLAARMQLAAAEALDLSQESEETRRMYGLDDPLMSVFAGNCLLARRLIERGVRFVQVYTRSQFWDQHVRIIPELPVACRRTDQPSAALVKDLKQRGLLDSTIVHWGGEMGRTPVIQGSFSNRDRLGRDHNTQGFSMWLAGGGFKRGYVHGATDEFGHKAVQDPVSHADYHATLLHLLGLDPERMAYRLGSREFHLYDGLHPGRIVNELLNNPPPA